MTPQELMDLPYARMAERQMRKQGQWDDAMILDGINDFSITVSIEGTYNPDIETQEYTVKARTKSEAMDLAEDLCDFDDIDNVEIVEIKETKQ